MEAPFYVYVAAGFVAQLVDGALGMAYGVTASSILLGFGLPVVTTSATVHTAECFTTGVSALSHRAFGNVSGLLFRRLVVPGVLGAILGAVVLSSFPNDVFKPFVFAYLIGMGALIVFKAFREFLPRPITTNLIPLGFFGAFLDAWGCGGWGPIVASTLLVRGNDPRKTVGTVNAAEFFVTLAASATFVLAVGVSHWKIIGGWRLGVSSPPRSAHGFAPRCRSSP
jgi:uncharacterized protein